MTTTTTTRRTLTTAIWSLTAAGSGTVTYHMFRLPGQSEAVWPESLPGAICERREKGGTYLASERRASSRYSYEALPIGTVQITIEVSYRRGVKGGSTRTEKTLAGYEVVDGKQKSIWR